MPNLLENYANHYANMPDDGLVRLSLDVQSLVPEARIALRTEMERRQIAVESVDWSAKPPVAISGESTETSGNGAFRRFLRNFLIFVACAFVYLIIAAVLFSVVPGIDVGQAIGNLTTALLNLSMALAVLTTWRTLKIKTVWIIGFAGPPAVLLFVFLLHLFNRSMS